MKILVTGCTGFIGESLTRKLVAGGHVVRVMVRDRMKLKRMGIPVAEVVQGDITDPEAVARAVKGVDLVYSIAGTFREPNLTDSRYRSVNIDAVRYMVEAAARFRVRRVVHCSTCGIHGNIEGDPAPETYPIRPVGIYEETKAAGEELAFQLGRRLGVEVVAIRPTPVYGVGDTRLVKLFLLADKKRTFLLGPGTGGYHLVYIDDLTDAFVLAGTVESAANEAFLIGGNEIPSLNELLQILARILGRSNQTIIRLPSRPFWLLGWLCETMCRPFNIAPPIFRRRVEFFINNRAFDIEKARRVLGYQPRVSLEEGLRRTATWYRENGLLPNRSLP